MNKVQLRDIIKQKKKKLPKQYFLVSNKSIYQKIIKLKNYIEAKNIFIYVSKDDEVDTKDIIINALKNGKKVLVPKCIANGIMIAVEIKSLNDLKLGKFDILEPKSDIEADYNDIDLCIVPCLSCDKYGNRLGYGKGYYDRFLKSVDCIKAVLCYEKMMSDEIPHYEFDVKMDIVLSEI